MIAGIAVSDRVNQTHFTHICVILQFSIIILISRSMWRINSLFFSDLNMLAESEGSQHLNFQEHSKSEFQRFYNYVYSLLTHFS